MPLLTTASHRSLQHSLHAGAYFTDGTRLYRVAASLVDPWNGSHSAELEDCLTLDTALHGLDALAGMRLELVRPTGTGQGNQR